MYKRFFRYTGFTMIELLISVVLLLGILGIAISSLRSTGTIIQQANRLVPIEARLQNGMDKATRLIRQANDVTPSTNPPGVQLLEPNGTSSLIYFSNNTLWKDQIPLQDGIQTATFTVSQGSLAKFVTIDLTASHVDSQAQVQSKELISSVSLRNILVSNTTNTNTGQTTTTQTAANNSSAATSSSNSTSTSNNTQQQSNVRCYFVREGGRGEGVTAYICR